MIKLFSCVGIGAATVLCVNVAGAQSGMAPLQRTVDLSGYAASGNLTVSS